MNAPFKGTCSDILMIPFNSSNIFIQGKRKIGLRRVTWLPASFPKLEKAKVPAYSAPRSRTTITIDFQKKYTTGISLPRFRKFLKWNFAGGRKFLFFSFAFAFFPGIPQMEYKRVLLPGARVNNNLIRP